MAQPLNITTDELVDELGDYSRSASKEIRGVIMQPTVTQNYFTPIFNVDDELPAVHDIVGNVVQGFEPTWNALGGLDLRVNKLKAYKHKINFPIRPANVLKTWASHLYNEKLTVDQMPISKYIIDQKIAPAAARDREWLYGNGVYDAANKTQKGKSMNGLKKILADGLADGSMYKIPISTLTDSNIVEQVENFVSLIPNPYCDMPLQIMMSAKNARRYKLDYRNSFGTQQDYSKAILLKEYASDWDIIGLPSLNGSDLIFATLDTNRVRLLDKNDGPVLTDVQKENYDVKVFFEWVDGIGFWINQAVFVSNYAGSGSGLAADNDLYTL